jgi:dipeptidyl aminopeptidase/acylaminoacyl peptidase
MKIILRLCIVYFISSCFVLAQDRREMGNLVIEGIPEVIPPSIEERYEQYSNMNSAAFEDWNYRSGGIFTTTRAGEVTQVFYISAPGAEPQQLTNFPEPVRTAIGCPDTSVNGFIYYKDKGGNENFQIFFYNMDNGESEMLTDGVSRNSGFTWNKAGTKYIYRSNKNDRKTFDFYIADFGKPESEKLFLDVDESGWGVSDWNDAGDKLILRKYIAATESEIYLYEMTSGALTQLNPSFKKISYTNVMFSKDGNGIFYVSDEDSDIELLRYYDISSGTSTILTPGLEWEVSGVSQSDGGMLLCFTTNENGFSKVYFMDALSYEYKEALGFPPCTVSGIRFDPDNESIGLSMITPVAVRDAYTYDIDEGNLTRWTYSEMGGLDPNIFAAPEAVYYPTFDMVDGEPRKIPALVYKPKNNRGKLPVIISIHGGPEGQSGPSFSSTVQFFVNELGAAVIEPNVRGSSGYGKTYLDLDNGYLRENSVKDIGALLDWIAEQPDLDAERVAVMGGSYGGYMTLASLVHYSDRIRCGIDVVGISNFVTFLNNTGEYRVDLRRAEYGDDTDPAMRNFLDSISPNRHISRITSPLFIIQGLNDPRVPVTEAEQMLEAMKQNGREVWYLMAKDEGHGFGKKSNRVFMITAEVMFLEKYLLGNGL